MQLDLYPSPLATGKPQPLSRFLTQRKVFITIDDATEYKRCRVQSNRKGIVLRDLAKGATINTKKQQVCQPGDFIVAEIDAKVGGYGFIPAELDGAIVSSHYYLFEVDESQLSPRYLHYLTQSDIIQSQISSQGSTNYAAIRPKEFLAIEIPYVEPDQQHEIVTKLDTLTREAEAFNQESAHQAILLTRLHQAVLREAIQGRLVPQNATDESASVLLARIHAEKQRLVKEKKLRADKPLPPLSEAEVPYKVPKGWVWCYFGDLGSITGGGTPQKDRGDYWGGTIPWVTPKDMKIPAIYQSINTLTSEGLVASSAKLLEANSVLIVVRGMILNRTIPIAINTVPVTINQDMKALLPFVSETTPYIFLCLEALESTILKMIEKSTHGTGKLESPKLYSLPIPLPPLSEQRRIVAKVTELLAHCTGLKAELLRAQHAAEAMNAAALREAFRMPTTQLA